MINQAPSAIRFYEDHFFIIVQKRNKKGERQFSEKEVNLIKWVSMACKVYKLHIVKLALITFPSSRFQTMQLLTTEEQTKIYETIQTSGRPDSNKTRPTI
jgi:DNA-binding transcriptional MerR regulator